MSVKAPTPANVSGNALHQSPSPSTEHSPPSSLYTNPIPANPSTRVRRASVDARSLTPNQVLHLQRTIGNQAVNNLLKGARPAQPRPAAVSPSMSPASTTPSSTIQRVVQSKVYELKKGGTITVYYSSYDTSKEFDDIDKAWAYDKKLAKQRDEPFQYNQRVATNFSYYNTKPQNVVPDQSRAGPHTLSHSSLALRLHRKFQDKSTDLKALRDEQVLSKSDFKAALDEEKPVKSLFNPVREQRMVTDYGILYDKLEALLQLDNSDDSIRIQIYEVMMRLMQMDPYTVYGKSRKMSDKASAGKGEREEDHFSEAFDTRAKFRKPVSYQKFREKRKRMYSPEREIVDEGEVATETEPKDEGESKDVSEPKPKRKKVEKES